jgi:hypothetical protein
MKSNPPELDHAPVGVWLSYKVLHPYTDTGDHTVQLNAARDRQATTW